jgi:putative nucleotidyltransferase with HDIG domain
MARQNEIIEISLSANGVDCAITEAFLRTLRLKCEQLYYHSKQVGLIVEQLGIAIGFDEDRVRILKIAGYLHDLGKHAIPNSILNKPGPPTHYEWEQIHQHSELGAHALHNLPGFEEISTAILYHHERDDGSGYPYHLRGDEIPVMSKLIGVADIFSATSSERPYKSAYTRRYAIEAAIETVKFNTETTEVIQKVLGHICVRRG